MRRVRSAILVPCSLFMVLGAGCDEDAAPPKGHDAAAPDSSSADLTPAADLPPVPDGQPTPGNPSCAKAQPLTLSAGQATAKGSTAGVANEFGAAINCGAPYYSYEGPQVYYRVTLEATKTYVISLTPAYSQAAFYVFGASCTAAAINADCGSMGKTGGVSATMAAGSPTQLLLKPAKAGAYTIAVDSRSSANYGSFELTVREFTPPGHGSCAKAKPLTLTAGEVTVQGTTLGTPDEYSGKVACGGVALSGPQVYYRPALTSGQVYRVTLTPSFPAWLYLFGASCGASKITQGCASHGLTGAATPVYSQAQGSLYFRASGAQHHVAVDSAGPSYYGSFKLELARVVNPPANGRCAGAKSVDLSKGPVTLTGDTQYAPNEFGGQVTCGGSSAMLGSQVYYRVSLTAGTPRSFTLTPGFAGARLVLARAGVCSGAALSADCGSQGTSGAVSGHLLKGKAGSLTFSPAKSGPYLVWVDSTDSAASGGFSLAIK